MEKVIRRELVGKVINATNDKTINVLVETYKVHPKYHKRVKSSKKYSALFSYSAFSIKTS